VKTPAAVLILLAAGVGASSAAALETSRRDVPPRSAREVRDVDRIGWWAPDFVKLQTGGYIGLFAVGLGYAMLDDVINVTLSYGNTPSFAAGTSTRALHGDLTLRPVDVQMEMMRLVPFYIGGGALYVFGDEFFVRVPERYRDPSYYQPTALHPTLHAGLELDYVPGPESLIERHGVYVELRTIGMFLSVLAQNPEAVEIHEVFASGLGYRMAF
jgi:hypothetical protein